MKKLLNRLIFLGLVAGAVYAARNYLRDSGSAKQGDVQILLDTGETVEPGHAEAQEFVDVARNVLEISGRTASS